MAFEATRRRHTARELAAQRGCPERTIRRIVAEPRDAFEARARERQQSALHLRQRGLTYAQIGESLGITRDAAAGLVRRAMHRGTRSAG